jgi:parallel beta-helix repeat protein
MKIGQYVVRHGSALLYLLTWVLLGESATAATYYVGKTGSDATSCAEARNQSTPKGTINAGIGCLSGGDTLIIQSGTYNESINGNHIPSGTSWSSATTIRAESPRTAVIKPSSGDAVGISSARTYIVFDGLVIDSSNVDRNSCSGRFHIGNDSHAAHIAFQNGEVRNTPGDLITAGTTTSDIRVLHNKIHDTGSGAACSMSGTAGAHGFYWRSSNGLIADNEIYNVSGYGVQLYMSSGFPIQNNVVRNNIIYNATNKGGIVLGSSTSNTLIYNNIIFNVRNGINGGGANNKIYNNTIYNAQGNGLHKLGGSGFQIKNNIVYAAGVDIIGGNSANNLTSNPRFVDAANGDFRLQSGSPAIDAGQTLSDIQDDFAGLPRPQGAGYDIGAYEFRNGDDNPRPLSPTNFRVLKIH